MVNPAVLSGQAPGWRKREPWPAPACPREGQHGYGGASDHPFRSLSVPHNEGRDGRVPSGRQSAGACQKRTLLSGLWRRSCPRAAAVRRMHDAAIPAGSQGHLPWPRALSGGAWDCTGNSIRGPSAWPWSGSDAFGLVSRAGIVPLLLDRDMAGPMVRSVAQQRSRTLLRRRPRRPDHR